MFPIPFPNKNQILKHPTAAHTLFQEIRLVACQTRVQLPDSYMCAQLIDFAISAVEEMVCHFDVTTSD